MDIHDCRVLRRPWAFAKRLSLLPRVIRLRHATGSDRHLYYDLAVHQLDRDVGRFLAALRRDGTIDDETIVVVLADHGNGWNPARPAAMANEFGLRHYREHLEIPLILSGPTGPIVPDGMIDTMGVGAMLVDLAGGTSPRNARSPSPFVAQRRAVITESAGRGNSDLENSDLFFTVTTPRHKLMTKLEGNELASIRLLHHEIDPDETTDRRDDPNYRDVHDALLDKLFDERGEILTARGVRQATAESTTFRSGTG